MPMALDAAQVSRNENRIDSENRNAAAGRQCRTRPQPDEARLSAG